MKDIKIEEIYIKLSNNKTLTISGKRFKNKNENFFEQLKSNRDCISIANVNKRTREFKTKQIKENYKYKVTQQLYITDDKILISQAPDMDYILFGTDRDNIESVLIKMSNDTIIKMQDFVLLAKMSIDLYERNSKEDEYLICDLDNTYSKIIMMVSKVNTDKVALAIEK